MGLPDKVTAPEVEITHESKEAVFEISVDPKCGTGSHRALFCSMSFNKNSEIVSQNFAPNGILRIVPPRKESPLKPGEAKVVAKSEAKGK